MFDFKLWGGSFLNYFYNNLLTHFPCHAIRKGFLRCFNKDIHPTAVILMHTRFLNFWKIKIEERVVINQYCLLDCRRFTIHIGSDTDIGPYSKIWTLGHQPDSDIHELAGGDVIIGHHVWIASNVTVLPNITIHDGAVLAASSLVHKSVSARQIVGGNPALPIRQRNNLLTYKLAYNPIFE